MPLIVFTVILLRSNMLEVQASYGVMWHATARKETTARSTMNACGCFKLLVGSIPTIKAVRAKGYAQRGGGGGGGGGQG